MSKRCLSSTRFPKNSRAHYVLKTVKKEKLCFKRAVSRHSVIFCASFAWVKMATARASVADIRPYQLGQPREQLHCPAESRKCRFPSRKCRFPGPSLVATIIFPHTKWLPKITDFPDTAALRKCTAFRLMIASVRNSWVTDHLPFVPVCCQELALQVERSFRKRTKLIFK